MVYEYEKAVPYDYIKLKKPDKIVFTDGIKSRLDDYYKDVKYADREDFYKGGNLDKDALSCLGEKYNLIRSEYIIPWAGDQYKNKLLRQEFDFLFACSYTLMEKFEAQQEMLNSIWGIDGRKLGRYDWYPNRSFIAYNSMCDKTMQPDGGISEGAMIAKCINQKVQAQNMCCAFTGISNDLDLFANIAFNRDKRFIMTTPLNFSPDDKDSLERANSALARMLFASGNLMYDDEGNYMAAGHIIQKIRDILKMDVALKDDEWQEFTKLLMLGDKDLFEYVLDGRKMEFEEYRRRFRFAQETIDIYGEYVDGEYDAYLIEFEDEHFGALKVKPTMLPEEAMEMKKKNEPFNGSSEELMEMYFNKAKAEQKELRLKIWECLDSHKILSKDSHFFDEWISTIKKKVRSNYILETANTDSGISVRINYEDRLFTAAGYWISEVFQDKQYGLGEVETYLAKDENISVYFDALNAQPGKSRKAAVKKSGDPFGEQMKDGHLYMMDEAGGIWEELQHTPSFKKEYKDTKRPQMVYVDTDAHPITQQDINDLLGNMNVVLVVHDINDTVKAMGLKTLKEELHLYISKQPKGAE